MIAVGVQNQGGVNLKATIDTDLFRAFSAVTNIVFAYCAHVAFFGLLAEMEEPRDFPKALIMLQTFEMSSTLSLQWSSTTTLARRLLLLLSGPPVPS